MNKDDLAKLMPNADQMKDTLEKNLKRGSVHAESKNGLVKVVLNYQQEITELILDNRLLDPAKSGALKTCLIEALNDGISKARSKMLQEAAKTFSMLK